MVRSLPKEGYAFVQSLRYGWLEVISNAKLMAKQ